MKGHFIYFKVKSMNTDQKAYLIADRINKIEFLSYSFQESPKVMSNKKHFLYWIKCQNIYLASTFHAALIQNLLNDRTINYNNLLK